MNLFCVLKHKDYNIFENKSFEIFLVQKIDYFHQDFVQYVGFDSQASALTRDENTLEFCTRCRIRSLKNANRLTRWNFLVR